MSEAEMKKLVTVIKPITTPTRRIQVGPIDPAEIDGPVTVEEWTRLGHIAAPEPASKKRAADAPATSAA